MQFVPIPDTELTFLAFLVPFPFFNAQNVIWSRRQAGRQQKFPFAVEVSVVGNGLDFELNRQVVVFFTSRDASGKNWTHHLASRLPWPPLPAAVVRR
jgi:hypothetical protein